MDLNGTWYNELGSSMTLVTNGNSLTGTYQTAVGDASGIYDLVGRTDTDNDASQAVGFVVVWQNGYGSSDSVTAWSGQYQIINGVDTIVTTWLLTQETNPDDDWSSTIINKDIFTKTPPSEEDVQKQLNKGVKYSHPKRK
ncbi:avidin/streptavidin family protein [Flavivirga jejuensis]|uniref:Avidin/streptavidin family protein n=1 Tax=Flavivirga jejuensis TaxID=870487 RepID=A0ABT8WI31_9FLAO|nr:avidin/streptavidin family protein [Flavivirga jejuensis]MDO5972785.1 avidin/streptavidin family protein [Flavivirga jejuensis]